MSEDPDDDDWDQLTLFRRMSLSVLNAIGLAPPSNKFGTSVSQNMMIMSFLNYRPTPATAFFIPFTIYYLNCLKVVSRNSNLLLTLLKPMREKIRKSDKSGVEPWTAR